MCMMKFALWLMKTALAAAVAASVSTFVSWAIVNAYVREVLAMYGAESAGPIGIADALSIWGPARGGTGAPIGMAGGEDDSGGQHAGEDAAAVSAGVGTAGEQGGAEPALEEQPDEESAENPPPQDALAVMGSVQSGGDFSFTAEQLEAMKDGISSEARMEIFSLILSKVPAEEIKTISALLEDGLDAEEIETARIILERYLTEEEMNRLLNLLL